MSVLPSLLLGLLLATPVRVGSKVFTESVVLGEVTTQTLLASGLPAVHRRELGGTRILWDALQRGDLDVYPEYSGTLSEEIFSGQVSSAVDALRPCPCRAGRPHRRRAGLRRWLRLGNEGGGRGASGHSKHF